MNSTHLLIDALIIVFYFVAITAIGLYMGRKEDSLEDYALGGRKVPWWAVMASLIAAETSAATFIGAPAEGFATRGLTYVQLTLGMILGRVLVGHIFLKPYYDYRVYTVYDFLAIRFGNKSRNCISALFLMMRLLASGVRLYVPSLVLVLAWRMFALGERVQYQELGSWTPYAWAIVILTVVTCVYTALGGIKAVIWTDVVQATLMFSSALVAIGTILYHLGGGSVWEGFHVLGQHVPEIKTHQAYILTGFETRSAGINSRGPDVWNTIKNLLETKYCLPAAIVGYTVFIMGAFGTDQDMVQRMLTAKDYKRSRRSLVSAALMDVPIFTAFTLIGVLLIAFYDLHPDLKPHKANDIFGQYILVAMPVVIRGFVLAGVFATAMGSLSAALNALATSLTNDWYILYFAPNRSQAHYVVAARLFTGLFAALMILIAVVFAYANVKNPGMTILPVALGIAGYILGPMLGIFLLGMLTRTRGSDAGNMIAVAVGVIVVLLTSGLYLTFLNLFTPEGREFTLPHWMPKIAFTWYVLVGALATFAVGILFRTPAHVIESASLRRGIAGVE